MTGPAVATRGVGSATAKPATGGAGTPAQRGAKAPAAGGTVAGMTLPPMARRLLSPSAETFLAIGVVIVVALLVVPLPEMALDALLALSMALALLTLLVTLSVSDPLEFSIFPSLLLLLTLLRLGLNVSSTRLILGQARAGKIIAGFGDFVIGGNYVVGLVIFLILIVINFVVITKGAGRIAEVAARFTLDAMPGRQMSIDADLSAGLIDEHEAKRRREEIARYADFYGAMDGSAKFVRGDAIAGLIIVAINLVGGFAIGMAQHGMSAGESLSTFASLTVGDGLVTQIPALIISTAAGILVTYGASSPAMAPTMGAQLTRYPQAVWSAAAMLGLFALVPGLPAAPFLVLASGAGFVAWRAERKPQAAEQPEVSTVPEPAAPAAEPSAELLDVDPLELEIGYALVPLVGEGGGDLLARIGVMRRQVARELGMLVPPVRVRDNIQLPATAYVIKLRGVKVAGSEILPTHVLALDPRGTAGPIDGIRTTDPSFNLPAVWVMPEKRTEAEIAGYTVVEPTTVLTTHLMEAIREHAAELLTRQQVRELVDRLKGTHPALVEELIPGKVQLGLVHRVMQRLLREGVPVRDLVTVLEAVADAAEQTKDPELLTEHVRRALAPALVQLVQDPDGTIRGITVGPRLEAALMQLLSPRPSPNARSLEPEELTRLLRQLHDLVNATRRDGQPVPLIVPPSLRVGIRRLIEPILPRVPVVSLGELPTQTPIQSLGSWELPRAA